MAIISMIKEAAKADSIRAAISQARLFGNQLPNTAVSALSPKAIAQRVIAAKRQASNKALFARYSKPTEAGMRAGLGG